jgi:hypothetical protein
MARPDKRTLRWFQFRLRTLLLLIALTAIGLMGWQTYLAPYYVQRQTMRLIDKLGGRYQTSAPDQWQRRLFGDNFENLTFVDLSDCDDPAIYLKQVAVLPRVTTLVVGGERFTDDHLRRLHRTRSLRALVLDTTSVTDEAIAATAAILPDLQIRRSERRAIAALKTGCATQLCKNADASLQQMVGEAHFQEAIGTSIIEQRADDVRLVKHLRKLQILWIVSPEVTDADLANLKGLTNLRELRLRHTRITEAGLIHLQGLRELRSLMLDHNEIDDAGLAHLIGLSNLEELCLVNTHITDAGVTHLNALLQLKHLDLDGTQITDNGLARLQGLTNLSVLWLANTRVTRQGKAEFRAALKDCRVLP